MRIKTNVAALNATRRMAMNTDELQNSTTKLGSGARINKAADDAAGLSVSENLRADVRSLNMAKRNTLDGISLVQTAEGGLHETSNMLVRLRELAVQAASDTLGDTERGFLDMEYQALKNEVDRIASSTEFNGTRLLIGEHPVHEELLSGSAAYPIEIQVSKDYYQSTDNPEYPRQPTNIVRVNLGKLNAFTSGENSLSLDKSTGGEDITGITSKRLAQMTISRMDAALTKVADYRSYLGAIQAHLGRTSAYLGVHVENIDTARSRIVDTDYAAESSEFAKYKILQQAGSAVLAQANQQPQIALSLLNGTY